jgi:hypothetical protein
VDVPWVGILSPPKVAKVESNQQSQVNIPALIHRDRGVGVDPSDGERGDGSFRFEGMISLFGWLGSAVFA